MLAVPVTMIICIIVGLPIRLIPKVYGFWMKYPFIAFIGLLTGFVLLWMASMPRGGQEEKVFINGEQPFEIMRNETLFDVSWFTIAFFLLHFYPIAFLNFVFDKLRIKRNIDWDTEVKN